MARHEGWWFCPTTSRYGDLAASAVVGTKGNAMGDAAANPVPVIHVRPAVHRVKYHYAYGIPAFALLAVLVLVIPRVLVGWVVLGEVVAEGAGRQRTG